MSNTRKSDAADVEINFEDEVDALFKLPLAEFTGARNGLAARLKRAGRADDANAAKVLTKPPVSAWTVNQLYWNHRDEFDRLCAAGQRVRRAQASGSGGDISDMRGLLEARREALSRLSELAASLLRDAGHNPTPDTIHRITTTLEAVSAYESLPDAQTLGRLTRDLDPPGFDSLASLLAATLSTKASDVTRGAAGAAALNDTSTAGEALSPVTTSQDSGSDTTQRIAQVPSAADVEKMRELEDARQARIAVAKVSLENAARSLREATARKLQTEASQRKADAEASHAARELRELEDRLKKARAAAHDTAERAQTIADETREATEAFEDATRSVEEASKALESLLRESPAG